MKGQKGPSKGGSVFRADLLKKGAFLWPSNPSLVEPSTNRVTLPNAELRLGEAILGGNRGDKT
jgi:hypothetical protein